VDFVARGAWADSGCAGGCIKTKRVRICVAIDASGVYGAGTDGLGYTAEDMAIDDLSGHGVDVGNYRLVYIEADVPLPETVTVQGEVVDGPV